MIEHFHLVSSVRLTQGGYTLHCKCSAAQFENVSSIVCTGTETRECRICSAQQFGDIVEYQVAVPSLSGGRFLFHVMQKDGEQKGVWKPDARLEASSLPSGFFFNGIYLNLTYDEGKSIRSISYDLDNFSALFTGIWRNKSELFFSGYVFLPSRKCDVHSIRLKIIKFRNEIVHFSSPVRVTPAENKIFGLYDLQLYPEYGGCVVYKIVCTVDMETVKSAYGYFNLFIEYCKKLVTPSNYNHKLSDKEHWFPVRLSTLKRALIVPFYNEFAGRWRLDIYHLSLLEWAKLKKLRQRCLDKPVAKDKNTWLIGEYNSTARDNGMHFYNFLCRKKGRIKAYYVIYRDSRQKHNLLRKNVVYYGSYKHFKIAARAGVLVFSHMPEFLLPKSEEIVQYKNKLSRFKTVFIQHGVIAMKSNIMFYARGVRNFNCFVVSSDFEKDIVHRYFKYDTKDIAVTGLARWDALYGRRWSRRDILMAPTWRDELEQVDDQAFMQSDFFKFWNGLLTHAPLVSFLRNHGVTIRFLLHIGMHRFSHLFTDSDIVVIEDGSRIGELVKESPMMVTDYSSIAFDMLFMERPVIFCPYDQVGSTAENAQQFIDFEKDIPGPVCLTVDAAVPSIIACIRADFVINKEYRRTEKKYFKHKDSNNCERLYRKIVSLSEAKIQ